MDSLGSLLPNIEESPESQAIKHFIRDKFDKPCSVMVQDKQITITVESAALAGSLRMQTTQLQTAIGNDKKVFIRIGPLKQ